MTEGHGLFVRLGTRAGVLGAQTWFLHSQHREQLGPFFLHPCPAPPLPLLPLASISIVPLSPAASVRPGPAHARQPATSSEAAMHNYNQLLRAASWPALQTSILIPRVPGRQQPALGSSQFSEGSAHTLGRRGSSPSLLCGSRRPPPVWSPLFPRVRKRVVSTVNRKVPAPSQAAALALPAYCLCWRHLKQEGVS